jgi:hypothetical protein
VQVGKNMNGAFAPILRVDQDPQPMTNPVMCETFVSGWSAPMISISFFEARHQAGTS